MKTFSLKTADCSQDWVKIDAEGMILGRMACMVAQRLKGKHKPTYTPHMMCGDKIVIINCDKVVLTGKKCDKKIYYRHTGYMGGLKETKYQHLKDKRYAVEKAIERMLNKSPQRSAMMRNLRLYNSGEEIKQQGVKFVQEIKVGA